MHVQAMGEKRETERDAASREHPLRAGTRFEIQGAGAAGRRRGLQMVVSGP